MAATPATKQQSQSSSAVSLASATAPASLPGTGYALFMHRAELQRRRVQYAKISVTKIYLTGTLINELKQRMESCSYEDLQILVRETKFKQSLEERLQHRRKQLAKLARKAPKVKRLEKGKIGDKSKSGDKFKSAAKSERPKVATNTERGKRKLCFD